MKTIILNWKAAANDSFSFFNKQIKNYLIKCGRDPVIVEITDTDWPNQILNEIKHGIEFVFTWQGLGSGIKTKVGNIEVSFWEHFKIPLVCVHGDHPCHMPDNHMLENEYCTHLYPEPDFLAYSNKYWRRKKSADLIDFPFIHHETKLDTVEGKYFVFLKNVIDPALFEEEWKNLLSPKIFEAYFSMIQEIKNSIVSEDKYVDFHFIFDEAIKREQVFHSLLEPGNSNILHYLHSQLDFYVRNYKSTRLIEMLSDFPIKIFGKGWDRIKEKNKSNGNHEFYEGLDHSDSQKLFYSEYGILDISPCRGLHDRSSRAMENETSFFSSAHVEDLFPSSNSFSPLFYNFSEIDLTEKCANIVKNPECHRALSVEFSKKFQESFPYPEFIKALSYHARRR